MANNSFDDKFDMRDLMPRYVVETRRISLTPFVCKYSPEVAWYGMNYVVGDPCDTYDEAKAKSEVVVEQLKAALLKTGNDIMSVYPQAK